MCLDNNFGSTLLPRDLSDLLIKSFGGNPRGFRFYNQVNVQSDYKYPPGDYSNHSTADYFSEVLADSVYGMYVQDAKANRSDKCFIYFLEMNRRKMRTSNIPFIFLLVLFLTSCSPSIPSYINPNWGQCEYPCWLDITPLSSNENEVEGLLKAYHNVNSIEISKNSSNNTSMIYAKITNPLAKIQIRFQNQIVQSTYITLNRISLGKIIDVYSDPDLVGIGRVDSGDYLQAHYFIIYNKTGIVVHILNIGDNNEINEFSDVVGIIITDPLILEEAILFYNTNIPFSTLEWSGYGWY